MPTPKEQIRIGIDQIDVISNADRLSVLGTRHSTPVQFQTLLVSVIADTKELARMDRQTAKRRAAKKAAIRAEWDTKGWLDSESGVGRIDTMGATARRKFADAEILKMEKAIVAENNAEREPIAAR